MSGIISVYIAGKFRAANAWLIEKNVRRSEEVSLEFCQQGVQAECPHTTYRNFSGAASDNIWLALTMEMLRRCDAIYLLKGWQESSGSRGEHKEAQRLGIPVFYEDDVPPTVLALTLAEIQDGLPEAVEVVRPEYVDAIKTKLHAAVA